MCSLSIGNTHFVQPALYCFQLMAWFIPSYLLCPFSILIFFIIICPSALIICPFIYIPLSVITSSSYMWSKVISFAIQQTLALFVLFLQLLLHGWVFLLLLLCGCLFLPLLLCGLSVSPITFMWLGLFLQLLFCGWVTCPGHNLILVVSDAILGGALRHFSHPEL